MQHNHCLRAGCVHRMNEPAMCRVIAGALAGILAAPAWAAEVACHYVYGGEERVLTARPVASPYSVPGVAVGSYFLFRVVFQDGPGERAGVHVYTYAAHGGERVLVHEASYRYPPSGGTGAEFGFTGRQLVYEPVLGSELEYWCEAPKP